MRLNHNHRLQPSELQKMLTSFLGYVFHAYRWVKGNVPQRPLRCPQPSTRSCCDFTLLSDPTRLASPRRNWR
jgi:hypothetical protein